MSADLYARLEELGIDKARVERVIKHENWGALVNAFEILTVLGVVVDGWPDAAEDAFPGVHGVCPACDTEHLFLSAAGRVTCGHSTCRQPDLVSDLLIEGLTALRGEDSGRTESEEGQWTAWEIMEGGR